MRNRSAGWYLAFPLLALAACEDSTLNPRPAVVASVAVTPARDTLHLGETVTLRAEARDSAGNVIEGRRITWATPSPELTVDTLGTVVGALTTYRSVLGFDSATVTATVDGVSSSANLWVYPKDLRIDLTTSGVMVAGRSAPYSARLVYSGYQIPEFGPTVTSSDTTIVAVDAGGTLRAKRAGSATLTAAFGDIRQTAKVEVVATGYTLTFLGTFQADTAWATDVNDAGQVTVSTRSGTPPYRYAGWLWSGGNALAMPTNLPSGAEGLNNAGQVVGWIGSQANSLRVPALWSGGSVAALAGLPTYDPRDTREGVARAINDRGQIAGTCGTRCVFRWQNGTGTRLDLVIGTMVVPISTADAFAINSAGVVAGGGFSTNYGEGRALIWPAESGQTVATARLIGYATAVNDAGNVAGYVTTAGGGGGSFSGGVFCPSHTTCAFYRANGITRMVGEPGNAVAWDLNAREQVVGVSAGRGFVWENGATLDLTALLPDEGWVVLEARAINASGQIVGYAHNTRTGQKGPVLLKPGV